MTTLWADEDTFRANLTRVLHLLLAFRQMSADQLADQLGIARSTVYAKLKTGKFSAYAVQRIAGILEVRVEIFYQPAEQLFAGAVAGPELGVVPPTSRYEQLEAGFPTGQGPLGSVG